MPIIPLVFQADPVKAVRKFIVNLARKFEGTPYIWGGSEPRIGFDCSGFVIWVLQVFEILPAMDWTADDLMKRFSSTDSPEPGDLCFYGKNDRATHVMMYIGALNGEQVCVGASGGNSTTTTEEAAKLRNAKVKMKPVMYRDDFLGFRSIG